MDGLVAPAWVVALGSAMWFGANVMLKFKSNGHGNGHLLEAREQTKALQAVTVTLTSLTQRLEQLPTREELKDVAAENRHEYRNVIAGECGHVREQIVRTESNLTRLIERTTP